MRKNLFLIKGVGFFLACICITACPEKEQNDIEQTKTTKGQVQTAIQERNNTAKEHVGSDHERIKLWVDRFDSKFYDSKGLGSYDKYKRLSTSKNPYHFMQLSYGINALNTMYEVTGDIKYLKANNKLIKNVIDTSVEVPSRWVFDKETSSAEPIGKKKYKAWIVPADFDHVGPRARGRDWMLYEGYLYRYVMEYLYILKSHEVVENNFKFAESYDKIFSYVERDVWDKWQNRSMSSRDNYSLFYSQRTHMGSHWGIIALYLNELSTDAERKKIAQNILEGYNLLLKNNFKIIKSIEGQSYYLWNATYDPLPHLSKNKPSVRYEKDPVIQDASHGNQVITYILTAYKLNYDSWSAKDIIRLCNTVQYSMWNKKQEQFYAYIDPSAKGNKAFQNMGFKQTDGWLKLARYDKELLKIYEKFYKANKDQIDSYHLSAQFYAQMANNYKKIFRFYRNSRL